MYLLFKIMLDCYKSKDDLYIEEFLLGFFKRNV